MQMALSLAIVRAQLTPEEAISAATVNAAWAAGRGDVSGTLEQGKRADILVMTVPDYRDISRQFGINHVGTVLRQGNIAFNRTRRKIMTDEHRAFGVRS
jgi:imidazolonepropionase